MAIYQIATVPDPILTTPGKPIHVVNSFVLRVLDNLADTLKHAKGIGLAAPQVSIAKRLAVVDTGDGIGTWDLINPEFLEGRDEKLGWDACLSIPGITGQTYRYEWLRIRTWNRAGEWVELQAEGLRARCIQHEMDHLDGILFTDKATRLYASADADSSKPHSLVAQPKQAAAPHEERNR